MLVYNRPAVQIPASFVVGPAACAEFMRQNRLYGMVEDLLSTVNVKSIDALHNPAEQIMQIMQSMPMPDMLRIQVQDAYQSLGGGPVMVWPVSSSSMVFQSYDDANRQSFLMAENLEEVLAAIKTLWLPLFSPMAIFFRELNCQRHRDARMAIAVQRFMALY